MSLSETRSHHLVRAPDGRWRFQVRSVRPIPASTRAAAWILLVAGFVLVGVLTAMRMPLGVHLVFLGLYALATGMIWSEVRAARVVLRGELLLDPGGRRVERALGLDALPWDVLTLPGAGVVQVLSLDDRAKLVVRVPGGEELCVLPDTSPQAARALGEALAGVFDLRLDLPDAIESPPPPAPELLPSPGDPPARPRPFGVQAVPDEVALQVRLRTYGLWRPLILGMAAPPTAALLFLASGGNWGMPILALALALLPLGARTRLTVTPHRVVVRRMVMWLPIGQEQWLSWTEVTRLASSRHEGRPTLALFRGADPVHVRAPGAAAASWAAARIRDYLGANLEKAPDLPSRATVS